MKILAGKTDCNGIIYGMIRLGEKHTGYRYGIKVLGVAPIKVRNRTTEITGNSSTIRQRFRAIK